MTPLEIDALVFGILGLLWLVTMTAAVKLPTGDDPDDLASYLVANREQVKVFDEEAWPALVGAQSASWREAYQLYRPKHSSAERRVA